MKKNSKIILFICCFYINFIQSNTDKISLENEISKIPIINFNKSMRFYLYKDNITHFASKDFLDRLNLFKKIYRNNNFSKIIISYNPKMEKRIHQIWLGKNPFLKEYLEISNKWKKLHPDWEYKLWTDNNIKELFPLYNQKIFDQCKNYGEKSDILRYEILYKFGGIYIDTDYECIKPPVIKISPFEILSHQYDFYAGIEPLDASPLFVGNAFIASCSNHPILKYCIETIKDYRNEKTIPFRTGPKHLTRAVCNVYKNLKKSKKKSIMIFPSSYLYPLKYLERNKKYDKRLIVKTETFGIHYWNGSWSK